MAYNINTNLAHQQAMREAFQQQLWERCRPDGAPDRQPTLVVGLESEYILIDDQHRLASEATRNQILAVLPDSSAELGACSIETHTDPVMIAGADYGLLQETQRVEQRAVAVAAEYGARMVRIGTYPGPFRDLRVTQQPPRYQNLLDISHAMHQVNGHLSPVQVGNVQLPRMRCETMCGCQSIHLNMQIPAGEQAIHLLNRSMELVPYLVALGAHSALLNAQPSGFQEIRTLLWEPLFTFPAFDARYGVDTQRVDFPPTYYHSWEAYWEDVANKLFKEESPDKAFESNMKTFWRTVRLKPCPGKIHDCLLEIRALSPQPTAQEDVALFLVFTGLLLNPQWQQRPLLPLELVKQNQITASRYGLSAQLYILDDDGVPMRQPARSIAHNLLNAARSFWQERAPLDAPVLDVLRRRLEPEGDTPARLSVRQFKQAIRAGHSPEAAAHAVLMNYVIASGE